MAPSKSLYPRSTVKRIIQAHSNRRMGKNTDIMVLAHFLSNPKDNIAQPRMNAHAPQVFLDYTLFMQESVIRPFYSPLPTRLGFVLGLRNQRK
jgi:hypothetical protein